MKLKCKLFGHKWIEESRATVGYTMVEQVCICKSCRYMKVKKQYISTVLVTIYSDEQQRVSEYVQRNW
jgi:hypothetical protein